MAAAESGQLSKLALKNFTTSRCWREGIYYIGRDRCMYQYIMKDGDNKCAKMMNIPEWVDYRSSVASHKDHVAIVAGWSGWNGDKRALLLQMTCNTQVTMLPDLDDPIVDPGVVLSDNGVYVIGGFDNYLGHLGSVSYLPIGSNAWQEKQSMPLSLCSPLVVQHQQSIYVLGGYSPNRQCSVSQYNIEDDTWKLCSNIPVTCGSDNAGVVVHEGRIKVITVDKCLLYDDDTDTWAFEQFDRLGEKVNAFVRNEQIWATVWNDDTCSMMTYDVVDNVWKTEHEKIDNAWKTKLFC